MYEVYCGGGRSKLLRLCVYALREGARGRVDARFGAVDEANGEVVKSEMMDAYADGVLCLRESLASTTRLELARCFCEISNAGLPLVLRAVGSDCDLDEDDEEDEGRVPRESHDVLLTLSAGKSESFLLSVSACNSVGESTSMCGGDMVPGEVHLLSVSSHSASLRDHSELESSHTELESSVSVVSDATERVGLVGLGSSSSSIATSSVITDLAGVSILAGAGSSRRTLASSTVSSAAVGVNSDVEEEACGDRRGFLL